MFGVKFTLWLDKQNLKFVLEKNPHFDTLQKKKEKKKFKAAARRAWKAC